MANNQTVERMALQNRMAQESEAMQARVQQMFDPRNYQTVEEETASREWQNALRRVRRAAAKELHSIHKERGGDGLMVINERYNCLVGGEGYTLSLEDVAEMFGVTI